MPTQYTCARCNRLFVGRPKKRNTYCSKPCQLAKHQIPDVLAYIRERLAPPDASGCRVWIGSMKDDYGILINNGKRYKVPRLVLEAKIGRKLLPWPQEVTRHTCNNRPCANEDHLIPGTMADNIADKVAAGSQARGEGSAAAKLTDDMVRTIRQRAASGERFRRIGVSMGVDHKTVSRIVHGRGWTHVQDTPG
jgi:hypothetical protein